ncbi:MAG: TRAP transporter small permease [Rhodospirillales bacterium]|nr:TRAP transporter small permease [Rhodospirillales bacterium]
MQLLVRFNARLERLCGAAAALCLLLFTTIVFIDVIYRQALGRPLLWPSEISVSIFVWSVMLGAAVCSRRKAHLVVEILPSLAPGIDRALRMLADVICLVFALLILWTGTNQVLAGLTRFTPMMGFPLWPFLVALPVPAIAMMLFSIEHLLTGSPPATTPDLAAGEEGGAS